MHTPPLTSSRPAAALPPPARPQQRAPGRRHTRPGSSRACGRTGKLLTYLENEMLIPGWGAGCAAVSCTGLSLLVKMQPDDRQRPRWLAWLDHRCAEPGYICIALGMLYITVYWFPQEDMACHAIACVKRTWGPRAGLGRRGVLAPWVARRACEKEHGVPLDLLPLAPLLDNRLPT